MSNISRYHDATRELAQAVGTQFRDPEYDDHDSSRGVFPDDPHELRTAVAAMIDVLDSLHGIAAGVAQHARAVETDPEHAGAWDPAGEYDDDAEVEEAGEPTEFRRRETVTREQLVKSSREGTTEQVQMSALWIAARLGQIMPDARTLLDQLREVTSSEPYDHRTGLMAGNFPAEGGWWSYRRELNPDTLIVRTELVEAVPKGHLGFRPRAVEARGTELNDPEPEQYRPKLDLDEPLPDPSDHGWVLDPHLTHPRGAATPTHEEGLSRSWSTPDGAHQLSLFHITDTRVGSAHMDNQRLPLVADLLKLVILRGAQS